MLVSCSPHGSCDFNPRPPRGGRRRITQEAGRPKLFQSTPPARGATSSLSKGYLPATGLQSTPPARGATSVDAILPIYYQYFNPRPPRGGRLEPVQIGVVRLEFQSTPPARGATAPLSKTEDAMSISIHAPREGGDIAPNNSSLKPNGNFNPRPPRGGRPQLSATFIKIVDISIHAPREGGDSKDAQFYLRIFDEQVELLRFLGKIRGGCLRNP